MRLAVRACCVFVVVLAASVARAEPDAVDIGARVTKRDKQKATLDRGRAEGLAVGDTGELYVLTGARSWRPADGTLSSPVASARIVDVQEHTATIAVDGAFNRVATGSLFLTRKPASPARAASVLFRVAALGIPLRSVDDRPFVTFDALLRDSSEAALERVLAAMLADLHSRGAEAFARALDAPTEGPHRGVPLTQILAGATREDLLRCLASVDSALSVYIDGAQLVMAFSVWTQSGEDTGEQIAKWRMQRATIRAAGEAARAGKLDVARTHWASVLAAIPGAQEAATAIAQLDKSQLLLRQLSTDADDSASRFALVSTLESAGAYALALEHAEILRTKAFDPARLDERRASLLVSLQRWSDAEDAYKRRVAQHPDDVTARNALAYVRAEAAAARSPRTVATQLSAGLAALAFGKLDRAIDLLEGVYDDATAHAPQRKRAEQALEQAGLLRQIESDKQAMDYWITVHDHTQINANLPALMQSIAKLEDRSKAHELTADLANMALGVLENELALELWTALAKSSNATAADHAELANVLCTRERLDEATTEANKSIALDPDNGLAHLVLADIAHLHGDLDGAEKHARKASAQMPAPAWAYLRLGRIAADRDDWDQAVVHLRKAASLSDEWMVHHALAAALRASDAVDALTATPGSARERLKLVRALGALGLPKRVANEVAKLPADGTWRSEGWWALATSPVPRVPLADTLAAARNAKPTTAMRKRVLNGLELRAKLEASRSDDTTRLALARHHFASGSFDLCLATLRPLLVGKPAAAVMGLADDARVALDMKDKLDNAYAAARREDLQAAVTLSATVAATFERFGLARNTMTARSAQSVFLAQQGRHDEAIKLFEGTRATVLTEEDPILTLLYERQLAARKAALGTSEPVRAAVAAAVTLCTELDDEECLQNAHWELAIASGDLGRGAEAVENARKAWMFADRLGRADLGRTSRYELVRQLLGADRVEDGERIARDLITEARKVADLDTEERMVLQLGGLALARGDGAGARSRAQEVYSLGVRTGRLAPRAIARRLEGAAWLRADRDPARAIVALEQAASLFARLADPWAVSQRSSTLRELAEARLGTHDVKAARAAAEAALSLTQPNGSPGQLAGSHRILAEVAFAENATADAFAHAQQTVTLATQTDEPLGLALAWDTLARAYVAKGDDAAAEKAYESAVEQLGLALLAAGGSSTSNDVADTARVRDIYHHAIEYFLRVGKAARAMQILEQSRDAQLKQALDPAGVASTNPDVQSRLKNYQDARARVRALQKQLDDTNNKPAAQRSTARAKALSQEIARTRKELSTLLAELANTHPQVYRGLAISPDQLVDRRQQLPADAALVEYFVAPDALYAFVVTRTTAKPAVVKISVKNAELTRAIADFRDAILQENEKVKARDQVEVLGRKLDDWLLEPLRPHLGNVTTLVVIPYGALHLLPFDALVVSAAGAQVRYAIEDFRISIQSTTTIEALLRPARPRSTGALLAIGNADGSLPGATREVNRLVKLHPDARVLGVGKATLATFRDLASSYAYIHIATHGILDPDPRKNYLKLSDGPLTLDHISELALDKATDMVVLSACESALEQDRTDEGEMLSLATGFALAGAPAVIASLWEVSDDSTAELMVSFYRALEQSTGDRLDAIRNAKLTLMHLQRGKTTPYAAPWHWASFQLYGDFRVPAH